MKSFVAGENLSASKYLIVQIDDAGKAVLATAASTGLLGVLVDGGSGSGDPVSVRSLGDGPGKLKLGTGGVTLSASVPIYLTAEAGGTAIATTTQHDLVIGYALENGDAGDIVHYEPCFFKHP
jgi:hypothetical protein